MNTIDYRKRDAAEVERMFSRIGRRYDLLNHVLSLGLDVRWRRNVARDTARIDCRTILDVCTGTGDMAFELSRFWGDKIRVEGVDFSRALLERARQKCRDLRLDHRVTFREANAEMLPYPDSVFDAVTITFGLRNIRDRSTALKEFFRVTRPGGRFVCLEFSQPKNLLLAPLYDLYLTKFVPLVSRLFGSDPEAYRYLGNTIKDFPSPDILATMISSAGWTGVSFELLSGGIVAIHRGEKPSG